MAVGAECHAPDPRGCPLRVSVSWPVVASHASPLHPTAGGDPFAVGAEGQAVDRLSVSLEFEHDPCRSRRPTTVTVLSPPAAGEPLAIGAV